MSREPLAARMRPRALDDIVGQNHVLGPGRLLRRAIEADRLGSIILYGPPGSGKTTIAEVVAATTQAVFVRLNAVTSGVADIRQVVAEARDRWKLH
ncbi:MAG TPA: AAA family ATPase, partial [Bacillota bacterium]|nr:AAA family ATPase [Bacillota bacterium]